MRREFVEQVARAEPVGDDHVGLGEEAAAADRDQVGVAGAAADQGDAGGAGAVVRGDEGAVAQALDDRVADGRGAAGVAAAGRGEDGDGDALAAAGGRGPGGRRVGVVGADAPDAVALRLGGGARRSPSRSLVAIRAYQASARSPSSYGRRVPGESRPPSAIASTEGVAVGRYEEDVRARRDQRREAALGHLAAAEDDYAAAGEAEAYGVGGVFAAMGCGSSCGVARVTG